jgi:ATP-dependent Clp protease ATP-binding subunit ClpA
LQVSSTLGQEYYHPTTGARKLLSQLDRQVSDAISGAWLDKSINDNGTVIMERDDTGVVPFKLRYPLK